MFTVSEAIEKLASAGTPDQIALELESHNIRAVRDCATSCAVAEYLCKVTNVDTAVYVASGIRHADSTTWGRICDTPENVGEFIRRFDDGRYPNLIAGRK